MGFLSSLFGTKSSTPSTTNVVQSKLPAEIAPFVKEILGEAQQLYKGDLARGYQPYTGATIAPLTPDQEAALTGLAGLPGTTAPFLERATEIYETGGERFTPETAQEFMSPYQRAVTDIEKREAQRQFESTALPTFEKRAVDAGGMSGLGTRAGVEAAEMQRGQSQLLADIEAKGLQKAYDDARKGFEQQKLRERGMAADLSGMGTQALTSGISELGAQKAAGEERQGLSQSVLDEAYYKFLEEQQFPQATLAQYQGSVYGNPLAKTFDKTETTTRPQPSTGQSLLSLGLSGLGMFGMGKGNIYGGGGRTAFGAGGGSVGGLSDKKLGNYMREGSGAISAGDRDQLMRMYKSGLSGLPVVKRQAGSYGQHYPVGYNPDVIESETIVEEEGPNAYQKYVLPHVQKITRAAGDALGDTFGTPSDVTLQVLNQLGITDYLPSDSYIGSEKLKEGIKEGMQFIGGDEALPPTLRESSRLPDLEVDDTTKVEEEMSSISGNKEVLGDRIAQLRKDQLDETKPTAKRVGPLRPDIIDTSKEKSEVPNPKKESVGFFGDLLQSNLALQTMVTDKIGTVQELQQKIKDAQAEDKKTREDSRSKRNELNIWKALLEAGDAVRRADPAGGLLAAAAAGASAGGKSFVEGRMKLAKEAEGDGQRAIDAAKTLLSIETADLKLQQALISSKIEALKAGAAWVKANNIKANPQQIRAASDWAFKLADSKFPGNDPRKGQAFSIAFSQAVNNPKDQTVWGQVDFTSIGKGAFSGRGTPNSRTTAEDAVKNIRGKNTVGATQK